MQHPDEGRLHEYADGALPPTEAAALERHLAECEACRTALGAVHALLGESDRLVATLQLDPPLGATPRPDVTPIAAARPRRRLDLRALGLAASAVLVVGVGYLALSPARSVPPEGDAARAGAETASAPAPTTGAPGAAAPATAPTASTELARQDDAAGNAAPAKEAERRAVPQEPAVREQAGRIAAAPPPAAAAATAPSALRAEAAPADTPPARQAQREGVELNDLPTWKPRVLDEAPATGAAAPPRHGIEGLQAVSHEPLPGGGTRSVYSVNGTRVELDQGPGTVPADRARSARYEVSWTKDGTPFTLRAALPPAEVEALRARVR